MINNTPYNDEINQIKKELNSIDVEINHLKSELAKLEIQQYGKLGVLDYLQHKRLSYVQTKSVSDKKIVTNINIQKENQQVDDLIYLSKLEIPSTRKKTLVDDVLDIVLKLGNQEFDSSIIMTLLTSKGIEK